MRFQLISDCACSLLERTAILYSADIGCDQATKDAIASSQMLLPCKHALFVLPQLLDFVSFVYMGIGVVCCTL